MSSGVYKDHNETKLHSRFISSLLNPNGSHGLNRVFLNKFLEIFDFIDTEKFSNSIVYPEEVSKKEYKNIDILIIDRTSKCAIIIENKIYAPDSNNEDGGQLERYFKIIRDEENIPAENIITFYLSLDGHMPSDESLGEFKELKNINGECLVYDVQILEWLRKCKPYTIDRPFLRESILQYEKLINKMTNNQTTIEERIKLKNFIGENVRHLEATKYLIDNFNHIKWHAISDFWTELEEELGSYDINVTEPVGIEGINNIAHNNSNSKLEECGLTCKITDGLIIYIWHEPYCDLWWGVMKKETSETYKMRIQEMENKSFFIENEYTWHKYIELENGKRLGLKDFTQENTFNLISNEKRKISVMKIAREINSFLIELKLRQ